MSEEQLDLFEFHEKHPKNICKGMLLCDNTDRLVEVLEIVGNGFDFYVLRGSWKGHYDLVKRVLHVYDTKRDIIVDLKWKFIGYVGESSDD